MAMPIQHAQTLIEKIRSLPENRVAEIENFVDFLKERTKNWKLADGREPLDFPVDDLGPWPDELGLRRGDLYGDNGR